MKSKFIMDEFVFFGAVKFQSAWRFFYDERDMWKLDYHKYANQGWFPIGDEEMNPRRKDLMVIDESRFAAYLQAFDLELTAEEIAELVDKPQLTYVVDFDHRFFVDSGKDDVPNLLIEYVPSGWQAIERNPYYYVPAHVRNLWMNKHVRVGENGERRMGIYDYTYVGAIKHASKWSFHYGMLDMWMLDFESFISRSIPDYFTNPICSDWRKNELHLVDENQAEEYLRMMSNYELSNDEISVLTFNKLDTYQQGTYPKLRYVINFDEKIFIDGASPTVELNIDPTRMFVPQNWVCHFDNPHRYIPENLSKLWGKSSD